MSATDLMEKILELRQAENHNRILQEINDADTTAVMQIGVEAATAVLWALREAKQFDEHALIKTMVRQGARNKSTWVQLGILKQRAGKLRAARRAFLIAQQVNDGKFPARQRDRMARICRQLGLFDEAIRYIDLVKPADLPGNVEYDALNLFQQLTAPSKGKAWSVFTSTAKFDPSTAITKIRHSIDSRVPFSFIRLGDGEGNFLGQRRYEGNLAARKYAERIAEIMFGNDFREYSALQNTTYDIFLQAIQNADVLGVRSDDRSLLSQKMIYDRQLAGDIMVQDFLLDGSFVPDQLTRSTIHLTPEFMVLLTGILRTEKQIGMVTCRTEIVEPITSHCGCEIDLYAIPAEAKSRAGQSSSDPHFPDHYNRLIDNLVPSQPGQIFLIGAGILGKIYCDVIKQRGGIAIDIGSIFDAWAGQKTRSSFANLSHAELQKQFSTWRQ